MPNSSQVKRNEKL